MYYCFYFLIIYFNRDFSFSDSQEKEESSDIVKLISIRKILIVLDWNQEQNDQENPYFAEPSSKNLKLTIPQIEFALLIS